MTKSTAAIFAAILLSAPATAAAANQSPNSPTNPMFGAAQNQVRFDSIFNFDLYSSNTMVFSATYSQPNSFLRLPGRRSITIGRISGHTHYRAVSPDNFTHEYKLIRDPENRRRDISQMIFGLSQDLVFWHTDKFYAGFGIGPFWKEYKDSNRGFIGSHFMTGERLFVGYRAGALSLEVIASHYSNGHLSVTNRGLNGVGAAILYSF